MTVPKNKIFPQCVIHLLVLVCLIGCQGQNEAGRKTQLALESQLSADEQVELIAQIGDRKITLRDLERRLNEQDPLLRSQYGNSQRKIGFLIEWVRLHLLANEAVKSGLDNAPHVRVQTDAALVQSLLEQVGRDTLRTSPVVQLSKLPAFETDEADARTFDALRQRHQTLVYDRKKAAVVTVLTEYDAQRKVTYRQDAWTQFKANHTRRKDVPK
jgi:hypothetical protein